ncbi:iron chelate uptake ABC transporter family permease subunit [Mycolicibacterium goodii]|nr:iron chelate uptake ABC transporter family permease subunit [Mycolicibacterium goodii]
MTPSVRSAVLIGGFTSILCVSVVLATLVGTADIGPADVLGVIAHRLGLGEPAAPPLIEALVWESRLPRVLLAALVGCGLSVSGAVLQAVTRNPLAEPYLLGVSSGASAGAVAIMVLGVGSGAVTLTVGAFAGALMAFAVVLMLIGGGSEANPTRVVLTGMLVSQFFAALTSLVLMLDGDADSTRAFTYWLLGSLGGARWEPVLAAALMILVGVLCCWFFAAALDAYTFGWDTAASMGVNVARSRALLMIFAALITAAAVAVSGAIGFIGLLVPHIVRLLTGGMHRLLLPLSALGGAVFLIWVDAAARTVFSPHEIPVGVITALLGAPLFAVVLRRVAHR